MHRERASRHHQHGPVHCRVWTPQLLLIRWRSGIAEPSRMPDTPGGDEDGNRTGRAEKRSAGSREPSGLVAIQIISMGGPSDPVLADLMEKAFEAAERNPNRLRYGPEWQP